MRALASLCVCVCRLSLAAMCLCHLLRQLAVFVSRCILVFELFTRSRCMLHPFLSACVCVWVSMRVCGWVSVRSLHGLCVSLAFSITQPLRSWRRKAIRKAPRTAATGDAQPPIQPPKQEGNVEESQERGVGAETRLCPPPPS